MNSETLKAKFSQLSLSDLKALIKLSKKYFKRLISTSKDLEEADHFKEEQKEFIEAINQVISNRMENLIIG